MCFKYKLSLIGTFVIKHMSSKGFSVDAICTRIVISIGDGKRDWARREKINKNYQEEKKKKITKKKKSNFITFWKGTSIEGRGEMPKFHQPIG